MRVRLDEPCVLDDIRYEKGEIVEVSERTQELNSGWMAPTDDELTNIEGRLKASEVAAKEAEKVEKAAAKAAKAEIEPAPETTNKK